MADTKHILWVDAVYVKYILPVGWWTAISCLEISDSYSRHPLGTGSSQGHCTYNWFKHWPGHLHSFLILVQRGVSHSIMHFPSIKSSLSRESLLWKAWPSQISVHKLLYADTLNNARENKINVIEPRCLSISGTGIPFPELETLTLWRMKSTPFQSKTPRVHKVLLWIKDGRCGVEW